MSWNVKITGTNVYVPTDTEGAVSYTVIDTLVNTNNAEQILVAIYAANPQRTVDVESSIIESNLVVAESDYVDEMTLHVMPYKFPTNDSLREDLLRYSTKYLWYYIQNGDYPAWWSSRSDANKWWAIRIVNIEHEHKHNTAVKYARLKIHFTRW